MRRRDFIKAFVGSAAAWPLAGRAQQDQMRRIGALLNLPESDPALQARLRIFRQSLATLHWLEDQNVHIDCRFSVETVGQGEVQARELLKLQPEVILAHGTPAVAALRNVASTVPVVFVVVSEPVAQGFAQSLSHPGGNITGLSYLEPSLGAKWLELLNEIAPRVMRVAVIFNPDSAAAPASFLHSALAVAPKFGIEVIDSPVHDLVGIEEAMVELVGASNGGLIVLPDVFVGLHRRTIIERAAYHMLPAIYPFPNYTVEGGLISYGVQIEDLYLKAATYVDRILRGSRPADLPIEQPTKFDLVINLKTANALGLTVPEKLLALADRVIE